MVETGKSYINIPAILNNPTWYRALHLEERMAHQHTSTDTAQHHTPSLDERAAQRLQSWKEHPAFAQHLSFANRLQLEGINEDELYAILGEPLTALKERVSTVPDWLLTLAQAFTNHTPSLDLTKAETTHQPMPNQFLNVLGPLLTLSLDRLQKGIQALTLQYDYIPFEQKNILRQLHANIAPLLLSNINRTLVLEMHIARLQEKLQGNTPEERFYSFLHYLSQPAAMLALLEDYPVLARHLVQVIEQWVAYSLEFLHHLCADWHAICATFFAGTDPGFLISLEENGVGDHHRGGQSVILLRFQSNQQLVYKPKSLAIDIHFQELLDWLNARGNLPPFRTLTLLNKGAYGWSEFVPTSDCTTPMEVQHFYQRQGGYLALLYILDATDFHFENLIAAGEHPMLIDLESLLHPHLPTLESGIYSEPGVRAMEQSVLRPILLPQRILSSKDEVGIDISGLGGHSGQMVPRPVFSWHGLGTDQMRLTLQRVTLPGKHNRTLLNGIETDIHDYQDHIVAGFTSIYHLLMHYRQEFIEGPLARFAHDEIRCLLRSTHIYQKLLNASLHPAMLHDELDRMRTLEYLWLSSEQHPALRRVIAAERADLYKGDIPFFTTYPDCRHLYTSRGECISDLLTEPSQLFVTRRVQQLNEQDLSRQLWFIQASLATIQIGHEQVNKKHIHLIPSQEKMTKERLINVACAIGERLYQLALCNEQEVSWMGLTMHGTQEWIIQPTNTSLYSGTPGIALFLAYLGAYTGQSRYTYLAHKALSTLHRQVKHLRDVSIAPGAFDGWGAIIYLYTHLGVLWQEPTLLGVAAELATSFAHTIEQDDVFDILGGSAGGILCLAGLYQATSLPHVLALAQHCGEHLIAHATPMPKGVGWMLPHMSDQPLTGFAHGAAGIALSLLTLAELTGKEQFHQVALSALEYERSVFSPQEQNWPDFRKLNTSPNKTNNMSDTSNTYMVAWCHGASGIALARLASLKYIDDEVIHEEISAALQTTLIKGFGRNHSLCHGDLGNLETLLVASQVLRNPYYWEQVDLLTSMLVRSIEREGWHTAAPRGIETPELMTGIAGIGYALLRLADPDFIPSVLQLAPPHMG